MSAPSVAALRRAYLEAWIERAITLLDDIDGDPDLEEGVTPNPTSPGLTRTSRTILPSAIPEPFGLLTADKQNTSTRR